MPDRLDLQEVRAREDEDEYAPRRRFRIDMYYLRQWTRRIVVLALLGILVYFAYQWVAPLRHEVSADGISRRLSAGFGMPVKVSDVRFRLTPKPRMIIAGIDTGFVLLPEVALHFNWEDALRAMRGGEWVWGEALFGPMKLDQDRALALLRSLQGFTTALPATISTMRFESIEIDQIALLPGRYEVVVRRDDAGRFGVAQLTPLGEKGSATINVQLKKTETGAEAVAFQLEATGWRPPYGPAAPWTETTARGVALPDRVEVSQFQVTGFFGVIQGALAAVNEGLWKVEGAARATNIDLEAVTAYLRGGPVDATKGTEGGPVQGTVAMELIVAGQGESLRAAIEAASASGPLQLRWTTLNGINLGYAATRGGTSAIVSGGGITRFSELDASIVLSSKELVLRGINGRAGAMATQGQIRVAPDLSLSGALRVDMGETRVQAPINVKVGGTVLQPSFGR